MLLAVGLRGPAGSTLIVRHLATGRDTTFGNVAEFAWQDKGRLLAIAIATEDKTGNGVQLFDPETGALRVLDSSSSTYSGLAWRKAAADLAVLRSRTDDRHDGPTHVALAWTHVGDANETRRTYDPTADSTFPATLRTVAYREAVVVRRWVGGVSRRRASWFRSRCTAAVEAPRTEVAGITVAA